MIKNTSDANGTTNATKSLTISELAKRHLNDPTHTTTDEELRNARLELSGLNDLASDDADAADNHSANHQ